MLIKGKICNFFEKFNEGKNLLLFYLKKWFWVLNIIVSINEFFVFVGKEILRRIK